jgi:hypothetical protein
VLTQLSTADSSVFSLERHCGLTDSSGSASLRSAASQQARRDAVCRGDERLGEGREDGLLSAGCSGPAAGSAG